MEKINSTPCRTNLYLWKALGTWYLSGPECASIPASHIYPKALMAMADQWAVNKKISFNQLLKITGEC